jgi:hypothetical protein
MAIPVTVMFREKDSQAGLKAAFLNALPKVYVD